MRCISIIVFLSFFGQLKANNYYFSTSSGNDQRSPQQAQNPSTPWQTLNKLNSLFSNAQPGDSILFSRGEIFTGSITISASGNSNSPIVFGAYGTGAKPIISGFTTPTNWTPAGNGTFTTTSSFFSSNINLLLINGQVTPVGRYPNTGFLTIDSYNGTSQITDNQLSSSPNWTNGEVVIRKNRWIVDRNFITQHSGNTINYTSQSSYSPSVNFGYFIQNHPKTLDQNGEWYFKPAIKELGVFFANNNPASYDIKATTVSSLIFINNQDNITFDNINFQGANISAFEITGSQRISISNCDILFSGTNAINASGSDNLAIVNSTINYTNNIAFNLTNCSNAIIKNNQIKFTGIFTGMGNSGDGTYEAILIGGDNNDIELNEIDSTGYIPLSFSGNNVTIKNNFINNFEFVKDDGGGIYTWNNSSNAPVNYGRKIISNVILNGIGAGAGTDNPSYLPAHGIYMDDNAAGVAISSNTVANCGEYGIYIHNAHEITINNNTVFNNKNQLGMVHDNIAAYSPVKNTTLFSNVFFSVNATSHAAEFKTIVNDISNFGAFDSNYYCRPVDDNLVINTSFVNNGTYYNSDMDLAGWKTFSGDDKNSKKSPVRLAAYTINNFIGSNKVSNGNFNSDINGLYCYSASGNCSVSWKNGVLDGGCLQVSFTSITGTTSRSSVIIGIGAVTANKTYVLRFSMSGTNNNNTLETFLRQSLAGYKDLSVRKYSIISASRTENEILFTPTISEPNASLVFNVQEQNKPLYLDNIQLYEANVTALDPMDSIRFEYNASPVTTTVSLDAAYIDVKNKTYSGSITLPPFSSVILIKQAGTSVPASPTACSATGTILHEQWDNIAGNDVSDIPLLQTPTSTSQLNVLEFANIGSLYGTRLSGYICPPQSGNYTFWIAADDAAELWLSTDNNPANKVKIASLLSWTYFREWNKFPSQQSAKINLRTGQSYYIEVLHKQGGGGDNLSVQWQMPDGTTETPVPGTRLSPYTNVAGRLIQENKKMKVNQSRLIENNTFQKTELTAYPNPFKNFTTVTYNPLEAGEVRLNMFDIQGRQMQQIFQGNIDTKTTRNFIVKSQGLSQGIYFIQLTTKTKTVSKKIILMK